MSNFIVEVKVSVKIYGNPDESRWNSLDPYECLLADKRGGRDLGTLV